jgi:carbonic anhydrase
MPKQTTAQNHQEPSRRGLFVAASGVATVTLAGSISRLEAQTPVALTQKTRDELTPNKVIEKAKEGNRRYLDGKLVRRDFLAEQKATSEGQYPAAIVLGCIDSRGPAEIIFNLGIGDIFNARVAGSIENDDILGSMEYATKVAGAKLVVVMGHASCGAIKGAIAGTKLGNLTGLLAKIRPAVEATVYAGNRTVDNHGFVDAVAKKNVEFTIANIRRKSPVLAEMEKSGAIRIVGAFHHLDTGAVEFL